MTAANLILSGKISAGRSFGAYTVSHSSEKIKELLAAEPYPGTLNVVLNEPFLIHRATQVDKKGKQFAVLGSICGEPCIIYRWHGAPLHVVEVIAAVHLKSKLDIKDGQLINITFPEDKIRRPSPFRQRLWRLFYEGRSQAYYDDNMHKLFIGKFFKYFHKKACQRKSEFV